jgi:hypothetical protein
MWLDPEEARKNNKTTASSIRMSDPWYDYATTLASHGDLEAFDVAMRALSGRAASDANHQTPESLARWFRWTKDVSGFPGWYASVRPELCAGRDDYGKIAFWLKGGTPFDQAYLASMDEPVVQK